ncbi:alkaline phosphatase family protein [Buchananella hordeovulneris]|uniref:alkaline phosphatase family protein n=1 Tax=Buchananella hordeovulneris TaxID=52770 RepID=UPI0009FF85A2|nr:alkaline phosphatase family protein [Buchananella hordeovulneris]MDO5080062.1 alkaline phosphatase family protein [Buchananella hordeovulneris]
MSELFARQAQPAAAPPSAQWVAPSATLGQILPAAAHAVGLPVGDPGDLRFPAARAAVVVLLDGLGDQLLQQRAGHAPHLRALRQQPTAQVLTTCAPSTTAAGISLLGTGHQGGATGMLGYSVRMVDGPLVSLLTFADSPIAPQDFQTVPTFAEHYLATTGQALPAIGLAHFAGSGLTEAALRGSAHHSGQTIAARVTEALRLISSGHRVVYLYIGEIDKAGHAHGWGSPPWLAALEEADQAIGRLLSDLPSHTLVTMTADHGMVNPDPAQRVWVEAEGLADGVAALGGEPRATHVYAEPGAAAQVAACWKETLGERAWVFTRAEAIAAGLFGPVHPANEAIIGDVVAFARDAVTIVDPRFHSAAFIELPGVHGSLTAAEMEIPLLTART